MRLGIAKNILICVLSTMLSSSCVSYTMSDTVVMPNILMADVTSLRDATLTSVERHAHASTLKLETNPSGTGLKRDEGSASVGSLPCRGCTL
jgi:hypothetical protein